MKLGYKFFKCLLLLLFFFVFAAADAQTFWNRTYGGVSEETGLSVVKTPDFGYLIAGMTGSYGEGASDAYFLKTDSLGNFLWYKTLGGNNIDIARKIIPVASGGYFVAGYSNTGNMDYDFWVLKLDDNADTIWTRKIGGNDWDRAYSVTTNSNEDYFVVGETYSGNNQYSDGLLIKMDNNGNTVWEKYFSLDGNNALKDVVRISDTRYAAVGTAENIITQTTDGFVLFFDSNGNFLDTVYYNFGYNEYLNCMAIDPNSNMMLGGYYTYDTTGFPKSIQIKIDSIGSIDFQILAGTADDFGMHILSYTYIQPDIFAFCGRSFYKNSGDHQAVVLKSYPNGFPEWLRSYGIIGPDDGVEAVTRAYDGGLLAVGFTRSYGPGTQALLLFKIAPNGDFHTSNTIVNIKENQASDNTVSVFPNPSYDLLTCQSNHSFSVRLLDANGRCVKENKTLMDQHQIITNLLVSGVYFVEMRFQDGSIHFEKILVQSK